jgi:hypothetical protein
VKDARWDLADEVMPQIAELLKGPKQSLAKLERKQLRSNQKVFHCLRRPWLILGLFTSCEIVAEASAAKT